MALDPLVETATTNTINCPHVNNKEPNHPIEMEKTTLPIAQGNQLDLHCTRLLCDTILKILPHCLRLDISVKRGTIFELYCNASPRFKEVIKEQELFSYLESKEPNEYYLARQRHSLFTGMLNEGNGVRRISKGDLINHYILNRNVVNELVLFVMNEVKEEIVQLTFYDENNCIIPAEKIEQVTRKPLTYFDISCNSLSKKSIERFVVENKRIKSVFKQSVADWLNNKHS